MEIKRRSILLWLFLSVITLGVCFIVWIYLISKESITSLDLEDVDKPGINILFMFLGLIFIYYFWWNYKMSRYIATIERKNGIEPDLLAPIFALTFGVVLHQSRLNVIASKLHREHRAAATAK